jgi:hypothetical protein
MIRALFKKKSLLCFLVWMLQVPIAQAFFQEPKYYIGVEGVYGRFKRSAPFESFLETNNLYLKQNSMGSGAFAGIRLFPYVSFEMSFNIHKRQKVEANNFASQYRARTINFDLMGYLQVFNRLDLTAMLGLGFMKRKLITRQSGTIMPEWTDEGTKMGARYGVGVLLRPFDNLGFRANLRVQEASKQINRAVTTSAGVLYFF